MRVHVDWRSISKNNYKDFCKEHPNIDVSYEDWYNIIYSFNYAFREHILETGERAKLPAGLGEFSIKKKKKKKKVIVDGVEYINLPIDWKKTMEKGKRIYNFNFHTEGYSFGWWWFKRTSMFKFSNLWYFKPSRTSSRLLAHYINVNNEYQHKYREWLD